MEPNQIEVAPPESGELVVRMNGEELPQKRRPGRPLSNPAPVRSDRQKAADTLRKQEIELTEEQFDQVWSRYLELRRIFTEDQLSRYWFWRCRGCADGDSQGHAILNNRHHDSCDTIDQTLKYCWPRSVVEAVCAAKGIEVQF